MISKTEAADRCSGSFECVLNEERLFTEKCTVSSDGVDINFTGANGVLVPAFLFDGANETEIMTAN